MSSHLSKYHADCAPITATFRNCSRAMVVVGELGEEWEEWEEWEELACLFVPLVPLLVPLVVPLVALCRWGELVRDEETDVVRRSLSMESILLPPLLFTPLLPPLLPPPS